MSRIIKAIESHKPEYLILGVMDVEGEVHFIEVKKVALTFLEDLNFNNDGNFSPRVKNICSGKGISILEFSNYW